MAKTRCPKCKKYFDDDFNRYVIGSVTNTVKFVTNFSLRYGGGLLGSLTGNEMIARGCGKAGKELAESIGCGEKDMNGWQHKCPYCGHRWD